MKKSPNPANHINYKISKNQNNFNVNLRKIRLIEDNAICRHLNKLTCKGTLWQVFIYLVPSRLLDFILGWPSNFVGSESCQIQSVKLLQNMLGTPYAPPPPPHTQGEGGERGEGIQGNRSKSWVENTSMTECSMYT
jgi:hypothetical protein